MNRLRPDHGADTNEQDAKKDSAEDEQIMPELHLSVTTRYGLPQFRLLRSQHSILNTFLNPKCRLLRDDQFIDSLLGKAQHLP